MTASWPHSSDALNLELTAKRARFFRRSVDDSGSCIAAVDAAAHDGVSTVSSSRRRNVASLFGTKQILIASDRNTETLHAVWESRTSYDISRLRTQPHSAASRRRECARHRSNQTATRRTSCGSNRKIVIQFVFAVLEEQWISSNLNFNLRTKLQSLKWNAERLKNKCCQHLHSWI